MSSTRSFTIVSASKAASSRPTCWVDHHKVRMQNPKTRQAQDFFFSWGFCKFDCYEFDLKDNNLGEIADVNYAQKVYGEERVSFLM
jgi:hypothetical protein